MPGMNMDEGGMQHGEEREPGPMMFEHFKMFSWAQAVVMVLGVWLATAPFALGYQSAAMTWNDVLCGGGVVVLGALSVGRLGLRAGIANALVGVWLLLAPLVFWAPTPAAYANDTIVGALIISFAVVLPMSHEMRGADVPRGWSYNPSSWQQRAPIIALGFFGFFVSRYMASYQLGYVGHAWDPFFGDGTKRVLESDVSKAWPVSDAGLGAATYMLETLSGFMGDKRRWRTMPWMVAIFGVAVIPLGIVSIVLIVMQPVVVGAWCTLCLATSAAMLVMVALSVDEVAAMIQFLVQSRREGKSVWRTFWRGGNVPADEGTDDVREPAWRPGPMTWGVSAPVGLLLSAAMGVWLMFAPAAFGIGIQESAANSDHLAGALVVVVSVIAMAEVTRPARFLNVLIGAWLLSATWFLAGGTRASHVSDAAVGLLVILLSLPGGRLRDQYGSLDGAASWRLGRLRSARAA